MIRLFEKDVITFTSNGITVLNNLIKASSNEVLNGLYSAEFEAIYDQPGKWKEIKEGRIIHADGHPFRIFRTRKGMTSLYVYARHVFWDLVYNEVRDIRPTNKGAQAALEDVLGAANYLHPFTAYSDISKPATQYFINRNIADCIMGNDSVLSKWNGELKLDGWQISILTQRGQDNGVSISYRKNILDVEVTEDYEALVTRVRPKGKDGMELPEVYVDSPYISSYVFPRIKEVEFDIGVDDETTEEEAITQLREAATSYFTDTKCDFPVTNIKVDMLNLENTEEYRNFKNLVKVALGDTVTCKHTDIGIDHKSRVISIEKDLLLGRTSKIEIGDFQERISRSITRISDTQKALAQIVERNNLDLSAAILNSTALLTTAMGGYVLKRNGEILIMDTEDPATATQVWRWNINGLGYSSGPGAINGPYGIAMTMDGKINASFITTGELDAAIVETGTIESDKLSVDAKQVLFEMVEVGATNLLEDSERERTSASEYIGVRIYEILEANPGKELTFSFDLKSAIAGDIAVYALGDYNINYLYFPATTSFQRFSYTLTPVKTGSAGWADWSFYGIYSSGKIPTIRRLKIEIGNKATDWSPHPKELYSGITRIDKAGINVGTSSSSINTQLLYDGLRVKDGTTELASFGGGGAVVPNLQATTIRGDVLNTMSGYKALHVGSGQTYSTVTDALNSLGSTSKILTGYQAIDIIVHGTINDFIDISGFQGDGSLALFLYNGAVINGFLLIRNNNCRVTVASNGTGKGTIKRSGTWNGMYTPVTLLTNKFVTIENINIDGDTNYASGIDIKTGGYSYINEVDIVRTTQGIFAIGGAMVTAYNNKGNVADVGVYSLYGAVVFLLGTIPNGTGPDTYTAVGSIYSYGTITPTNSSYSPPAATPTVFTSTFVHTSVYTVVHDTTTVDTYYGASACQNRWDSTMGWKDGVFTFGSDIYNYWQGGYNVLVEMRIRRKNSAHGSSGGVAPAPYNFSPSESFNAVGRGIWTDWTTVPSSVFGSGGATLKFYNGVQGSAGYAIWDSAEVKVTVTKNI